VQTIAKFTGEFVPGSYQTGGPNVIASVAAGVLAVGTLGILPIKPGSLKQYEVYPTAKEVEEAAPLAAKALNRVPCGLYLGNTGDRYASKEDTRRKGCIVRLLVRVPAEAAEHTLYIRTLFQSEFESAPWPRLIRFAYLETVREIQLPKGVSLPKAIHDRVGKETPVTMLGPIRRYRWFDVPRPEPKSPAK